MSRLKSQGRIGPNAIIRIQEALEAQKGQVRLEAVFKQAGLERYLISPPVDMVPEAEVIALHQALRAELGVAEARAIAWDAGRRTGDYLLACRIPKPAQWLLRRLPGPVATRLLLRAIAANAWTFVGSGRFAIASGLPAAIRIDDSPLCRGARSQEPLCDFYAGTFERLLQALVHPKASVAETECAAQGAPACRFELR